LTQRLQHLVGSRHGLTVDFVGALALAGAFLLPWVAAAPSILSRFFSRGSSTDLATTASGYELGANLLNFGALIAFMGVNLAAFVRYYLHNEEKKLSNLLPPVLGFVICFALWVNLSPKALIFGTIWMGLGIAFGAVKTRGFRGNLIDFELPPEEA